MTHPLPPEAAEIPEAPRRRPTYSRLALFSLVCSALGLLSMPVGMPLGATALMGLAGLVLAIAALVCIFRSRGLTTGYTSAALGIVLSCLCLISTFPTLGHPPGPFIEMEIRSNIKQLCLVGLCYTTDHDGRFPPPDSWHDVFVSNKYVRDDSIFKDPRNPDAGRAYAMNAHLAGLRLVELEERPRTVLFFECAPGSPPSGGRELLSREPPHGGGYFIGMLDAHVEWVPPEDLDRLIWDPKAGPAAEAREAAPPPIP